MHQDHTRSNQGHKDKCHPRRIVGKQHNHGDANEPHDRQRYLILRDTLARFARSQWHKAKGLAEVLRPCLRGGVNTQLKGKERGQDAKDSPLGFVHGRVALMWPEATAAAVVLGAVFLAAASFVVVLAPSGPKTCHWTRGRRKPSSTPAMLSMVWYSTIAKHTPNTNITASLSDMHHSLPNQRKANDNPTQARRPPIARASSRCAAKRKTERRGALLWLNRWAGRVRRLARGERVRCGRRFPGKLPPHKHRPHH